MLVPALILAGCGVAQPKRDTSLVPLAPPTVVAVRAPVLDRTALARVAVMTAYTGYLKAETQAAQSADFGSPDLARYAADPLLGQLVAALNHLSAIGAVQRGAVGSSPRITALEVSDTTGTATVRDCLDESTISVVYASTNKALSLPGGRARYVATITAYLYPDGRWLFSKAVAHRDQSC